jgi:hypothetical protein
LISMSGFDDHAAAAVDPSKPKHLTRKQLAQRIERVEDSIQNKYGFRPEISDDITGLRRNSFSSLYDPITFSRDGFWPMRRLPDPASPPEWSYPLSVINGSEPPARAQRYTDGSDVLLNAKNRGKVYLIEVGNRGAGTRSGVHLHDYGGITWILKGGDITLYAQGISPATFKEHERYFMPSGTPMSANNLSKSDSVLMDLFVYPKGGSPISILEPGY